jgi:VanZ family protein
MSNDAVIAAGGDPVAQGGAKGEEGILRWVRRVLWGLLGAYWGLIFLLTHLPAPDLPSVKMSDKLEHFLAYGLLGGLLFLTWWSANPRRRWLGAWVWIVGLSYGAIDELLQALVGRDCELGDWLADAAAVTIAVLVLSAVRAMVKKVGSGQTSTSSARLSSPKSVESSAGGSGA